jgi:hypothetical protein
VLFNISIALMAAAFKSFFGTFRPLVAFDQGEKFNNAGYLLDLVDLLEDTGIQRCSFISKLKLHTFTFLNF